MNDHEVIWGEDHLQSEVNSERLENYLTKCPLVPWLPIVSNN